ncbi:hypothetical protein DI135_15585 [Legionella pneumophila]|uniref:Uncharacterized protein n=1 Tax=Legionella pneumophila TaxID=446 RepID=A0A2S6F3C3_LEGPN|nr:hypothetical protein BIZ51_03715 [Legionella pneumophila subsp. fraseri]AUB67994.1 hypothetical protein BJK09_03720 [Legionella pneumophila]AUB70966.1 hypothetical protein BJK08_03715 [Legionella pneumophila]KXB23652.1 hypothetical protein PtVF66_13860 [Legionella pneumophila]KXB23711.1 hypothetical protein PtVF89_13190 [Legionella pneumophila]
MEYLIHANRCCPIKYIKQVIKEEGSLTYEKLPSLCSFGITSFSSLEKISGKAVYYMFTFNQIIAVMGAFLSFCLSLHFHQKRKLSYFHMFISN